MVLARLNQPWIHIKNQPLLWVYFDVVWRFLKRHKYCNEVVIREHVLGQETSIFVESTAVFRLYIKCFHNYCNKASPKRKETNKILFKNNTLIEHGIRFLAQKLSIVVSLQLAICHRDVLHLDAYSKLYEKMTDHDPEKLLI